MLSKNDLNWNSSCVIRKITARECGSLPKKKLELAYKVNSGKLGVTKTSFDGILERIITALVCKARKDFFCRHAYRA